MELQTIQVKDETKGIVIDVDLIVDNSTGVNKIISFVVDKYGI